jgi:hypothetical protein
MNATDKALAACCAGVAASTLTLAHITGYGTHLFQTVVLGAWGIVARLSSDKFADAHHDVLWWVTLHLNIVLFLIVAAPIWAICRKRSPRVGSGLVVSWFVLHIAMLFFLFPATDGP